MKSWELSKNIIAFFQSFPLIETIPFSFYSTVVTKHFQVYYNYHSSFDNPETKTDPYEIIEEIIQLLDTLPHQELHVDIRSNINTIETKRHQIIYEDYVIPFLQAIAANSDVEQFREMDIDLFSLQGLFDSKNRHIIPDVVNTVIYI